MGKLNYWEAYKLMFCFLDKYWEQYPDDELALLLGSMSPYTFAGEIPMDDKIVLDWLGVIKKENILTEDVEFEDCFKFMLIFLIEEQHYFKLDLKKMISHLETVLNNRIKNDLWTVWIDCYINRDSIA